MSALCTLSLQDHNGFVRDLVIAMNVNRGDLEKQPEPDATTQAKSFVI